MKKIYLLFLILFSVLLVGCNSGKIDNINKQSENHKGGIAKKNINHKDSNENQVELQKDNKIVGYRNDYYIKLLYLQKAGTRLLSGGFYLLKDVVILNEKMYKSLQEFQKLGSGLNDVEKNALQQTLKKYQRNLELQKEFMKSLMDRQNCLKNMSNKFKQDTMKPKEEITKPKQEITRPKEETSKPKGTTNGF